MAARRLRSELQALQQPRQQRAPWQSSAQRRVLREVDYEEYTDDPGVLHTWKPSSAVVDKITAFYAALNVANPDGTAGISVHFVFDTVLTKGSAPCTSAWRDGQAPFSQAHQNGFHYVYMASATGFGGQTHTPDTSGVSHPPARVLRLWP